MEGARTGRHNARNVVVMVGWSNTTPTSFVRPPHLSHLSTSILNVRLSSYAHEMRFRLRDFRFLFVEPATGATESCASAFCSTSMSGVGLSGKYLRCGERLARTP